MIEAGLVEAQDAIRTHPPETASIYERGLEAFESGQNRASAPQELTEADITIEQYKVIRRYLLSMAFMSAWYHLHGQQGKRDKAAQSASLLVSGVGLDSELVFTTFLSYEHNWQAALANADLRPASRSGCLSTVVLATAIGTASLLV